MFVLPHSKALYSEMSFLRFFKKFFENSDMSFGDVSTAAGLEKLNAFLLDNSYAGGWVPTQVDVALFNAIKSSPSGKLMITCPFYLIQF